MAPRLSGQTSIFGVVFFVSNSPLGIERQKKREKFAILTRKPRSHARILIYRTWPIGGGGPGLRRGGSFVNILQIWEGQICFICNWGRVIVSWQGKNYSMSVS